MAPPPKKPPTIVPPVLVPPTQTRGLATGRVVPPVASIVPTIPLVVPQQPRTPPTGTPDMAELNRLAASLDSMDYFELLHCERGASPADIKRSFYKWSRTFHPDKFFQLQDKALKERVHDVYKRITEAYYVLRDDRKRTKYLVDIAGPDRGSKLRYTEAAEVENKAAKKKEIEEQIGTHPKGRQFFQTGMQDLEAGRFAGAERNFKMALTYEPQNAKYKEKLKEAEDKAFAAIRERGDQFKIK
jgi:curved DNA-binding protein CbpA